MKNILEKLSKQADALDDIGQRKMASRVDSVLQKLAGYKFTGSGDNNKSTPEVRARNPIMLSGQDDEELYKKYLAEEIAKDGPQPSAEAPSAAPIKPVLDIPALGGFMTPFRWTGRAWRGSDSTTAGLSRGATVADIVRYEQDELGNNMNVTEATLKELENIPANRAIWVTKTKRDAQRYGKAFEVYLGDDCVAVGDDGGDGGFLVVCPRKVH